MIDLILSLGAGALLLTSASAQQPARPPRATSQSQGLVTQVLANENAAIVTLRQIAVAQALLEASGAIDTNGDGMGEYGFFGELTGSARLRTYDPMCDCPDLSASGPYLTPPLLPAGFGDLRFNSLLETVLERDGYYFLMFLPDDQIGQDIDGIAEDGPFGIGGSTGAFLPSPDTGKTYWCCYAWPVQDQVTGHRVFFINQEGRILQSWNNGVGPVYDGLHFPPPFDAAYSATPAPPAFLTGMGARLGNAPRQANDGNRWILIR